jgi:hypothetical protein
VFLDDRERQRIGQPLLDHEFSCCFPTGDAAPMPDAAGPGHELNVGDQGDETPAHAGRASARRGAAISSQMDENEQRTARLSACRKTSELTTLQAGRSFGLRLLHKPLRN